MFKNSTCERVKEVKGVKNGKVISFRKGV